MLTDDQRQFAEDNINLVYMVANKWKIRIPALEWDDLRSLASFGLLNAVKYYNPDKGKFSTLAFRCMDNEILMQLRRDKKHLGVLSLYLKVKDKDEDKITIADTIKSNENVFTIVQHNLANEYIEKLPYIENYVVKETLFQGRTNREIGEELNYDTSVVSRIKMRGLRRLQGKIGDIYV